MADKPQFKVGDRVVMTRETFPDMPFVDSDAVHGVVEKLDAFPCAQPETCTIADHSAVIVKLDSPQYIPHFLPGLYARASSALVLQECVRPETPVDRCETPAAAGSWDAAGWKPEP